MDKKINIAIDGPSGVGKSTIAKIIAERLNLSFINTGLMYRAIGFYAITNKIDLHNKDDIKNVLSKINIKLLPENNVELNKKNISDCLLNDEISLAASIIAKYEEIRKFCVVLQQEIAKENSGVVMEGRDIGTVVLPDAELKIFLSALPEIRAKRRIEQLKEKAQWIDEKEILKNVIERDKRDTERSVSPLKKAQNSIEIDTSFLTLEQVIDKIIKLAREKMN